MTPLPLLVARILDDLRECIEKYTPGQLELTVDAENLKSKDNMGAYCRAVTEGYSA
jgi:hypothetical protein